MLILYNTLYFFYHQHDGKIITANEALRSDRYHWVLVR